MPSSRMGLIWLCAPAIACFGMTASAHADPTIDVPPTGRGVVLLHHGDGDGDGDGKGDRARLAVLGEIDVAVVLAARASSDYPDIGAIHALDSDLGDDLGIEVARARVGMLGAHGSLRYGLRVDLSEGLRVQAHEFEQRPGAALSRFVDDAAVWWSPRVSATFVLGRFKVPHSRFRHLERALLTSGAVPFVVDRVAPDRRWGGSMYGDLGALAYAAGVYADFDALEPRRQPVAASGEVDRSGDPSAGGRVMASAYLWWIPRAPIGLDHMATPRSDPWFYTARPAAGLGVSWRERRGTNRLDVSLAGQLAIRRLAAMVEILAYAEQGTIGLSAAGQASMLIGDRAFVFVQGDHDIELDLWSAGGGGGLFVTRDRRNKISLFGWVRRSTQGEPERDGLLLQLQASL